MNNGNRNIDSYKVRIQNLKNRLLSNFPTICVDRDILFTEGYKLSENEPIIIRRAKALKNVLFKMPIAIFPDELIVGNLAGSRYRGAALFPEFSSDWIELELDRFDKRESDRFTIDEETKCKIKEILPYWQGKTVCGRVFEILPQETKKLVINKEVFNTNLHIFNGLGHVALGYDKLLKYGFKGMQKKIEERICNLDITMPENLEKYHFYNSLLVVCEALIEFAKRYSIEAKKLSEKENNLQRKRELEKISKICKDLSVMPPKTFHAALQSFFFIQLIAQIESNGTAISPGRFDYYMYPFYKKDLEEGIITKIEAQELLNCLWIKFNEIIKVWNEEDAKSFAGFPISQNLCVSGQTKEGVDSTNEISYMCLQALIDTMLPQPALSVRIHKNIPYDFFLRTCEVIKLGTGMPALYNDEIIITALLKRGFTLQDARNYAIVGCVEPSINGKDWPRSNGGFFNLAKILELALNDGKSQTTGKQLGIRTGSLVNFKSFEDIFEAFNKQLNHFIRHLVITNNIIDLAHRELAPLPFVSLLTDDCIEKGKDVTSGGAHYNATGPLVVGLSNVADSIAAIKKIVFKDQKITLKELEESLERNFDNRESIRQILLNESPKYGNDDDDVDLYANKVASIYCEAINKYNNFQGGQFFGAFIPVSSNVPLGKMVGATPDGRRAHEALAEGISPVQGRDKKGPTAVLKSVAKIDHVSAPLGTLLNMKFNPICLDSNEKLEKFISLIKTYFYLGGLHVQFNIVNREILRKAQINPEQYRDLVVRVAGYSAFFTDLDKAIQDDIMARTEHSI